MWRIRTAQGTDLAEVDQLLAESYPRLLRPDYPPSVLVTALPLIARAQPRLLSSGRYYVAQDDAGRIVGAGGWSTAVPGGGRAQVGRGNVRHLVTDYRLPRRGIARALMSHILTQAEGGGCRWLHCVSTRTAVAFYRAMGFAVLGEITVPLAPGIAFPAVEMRLDF